MNRIVEFLSWLRDNYCVVDVELLNDWPINSDVGIQCWIEAMDEYNAYRKPEKKINIADISEIVKIIKEGIK